jgi:hypothetical protein
MIERYAPKSSRRTTAASEKDPDAVRPSVHDEAKRGVLGPVFALENDPTTSFVAWCAAVGLHAALMLGATSPVAASVVPLLPPTEIELAPPPPLPEPPPPPEEPPPPKEESPTPSPPVASKAAPPAAARAGAVVAADPAAPKSDDLVDFVNEEAATSFGSGVVARGGTAEHGTSAPRRAATPGPPATSAKPDDGIVPAASLSRSARLGTARDDPCRGFYPNDATSDSGAAHVTVVVLPSGKVSRSTIGREDPPGQGFGLAAQRCLTSTRFSPALDRSGNAVATSVTISVRFVR